jgi:prolyl-tRNA editing enzyme YbaK/EbsC (Cys-tRNA(Pro) deacylase)
MSQDPRDGATRDETTADDRAVEAEVLAAVDATGEPYGTVEIDPALADTAAFCERYGYPLETSANCILVASKDDPPVLAACLALATTKLDVNKRVRKLLGVRKLSFAPPELTREVTGMEIGGVTPFALPTDLPLYVDARIETLDRIIVGGGSRSLKLSVPPAALAALGARFVEDLAIEL